MMQRPIKASRQIESKPLRLKEARQAQQPVSLLIGLHREAMLAAPGLEVVPASDVAELRVFLDARWPIVHAACFKLHGRAVAPVGGRQCRLK